MPSRKGTAPGRGQPAVPAPGHEHRNRRPTINDVARLAHVSKKTVSRVINDSPFVHKETREKISAIIAELGFAPDPQARGLAFRRSFLIGLICDDPIPADTVEMMEGILDSLRGTGFELVVRACSRHDPKLLQDARAFVEGQRLFAVLLPPLEDNRLTGLLLELHCPFAQIASGEPLRDAAFAAATKLVASTRPYAP
jgi:LacI family transcriptional regulator, galactose operon repressor